MLQECEMFTVWIFFRIHLKNMQTPLPSNPLYPLSSLFLNATDLLTAASDSFKDGNYARALQLWSEIIKSTSSSSLSLPALHTNRGAALEKMSMLPEAIEEYNTALSLNSSHYDALHNRGCAYRLLGRFEFALSSFRQALSIQRDFYPAIRGEAACLISLQRWQDAVLSTSTAISQLSSDPGPLADRGFANLKLCSGNNQLAVGDPSTLSILESVVSDFSLAISLGDISPETRRLYGVALSHLAVQQVSIGEFERAEATYAFSISIDETETRVLNQAQLYLRTNRPQLALAGFARAIEIDGSSPQARFAYGTLLLEQGDVRKGLLELHVARNLLSNKSTSIVHNGCVNTLAYTADLYYNLGYAELLSNEPENAKQAFQDAIKVNPNLAAAINGISVAQKMIDNSAAVAAEIIAVSERRTLASCTTLATLDIHHPALITTAHPSLFSQPFFESRSSTSELPDIELTSPSSSPAKALRRASSIVQTLAPSTNLEAIHPIDPSISCGLVDSVQQHHDKLSLPTQALKMSRLPSTRSLTQLLKRSVEKEKAKETDSWGNTIEEETVSARYRKGDEAEDGFNGLILPADGLRGLACPEGVNPKYRESFLSELEFKKLFDDMSKAKFYSLAKWRRLDIKRALNLF